MYKKLSIIFGVIIILSIGIVYFFKDIPLKSQKNSEVVQLDVEKWLNKEFPNIAFVDENSKGREFNNFSDKPNFVMFWASWCPDCQKQLPEIQKLYNEYKEKINFILIDSTSEKETKAQALEYVKTKNYTMPIYFDEKMAGATLNVKYIPTMFLVDRDNKTKYVYVEKFNSFENLKKDIEKIINK